MLQKITASCFADMIRYGLNNLEKHCATVNDLNVFPVPDGDTGTNMVMTVKNGLPALSVDTDSLSQIAKSFANGAVFGARGNSGVIISQFFKGLSEGFDGQDADVKQLSHALNMGRSFAYAAVAKPVEGTVLTVITDGAAALNGNLANVSTIDEAVDVFLKQARVSLQNTPNLLPILKKAGVIDSGGAGLVYFFEGIERYLNGQPLEDVQSQTSDAPQVDYSAFNRFSSFEYGYCTETLLQLTVDEGEFDYAAFCNDLQKLGESIVTSLEQDKIKLHIHTHTPERVLEFCHRFGEFLSLKIENMSVQHTQTVQKYLFTPAEEEACFALVAVAPNGVLQKMLSEMGADVVILSAEAPSSQEFIEAFEYLSAKNILVFPNSSNSILSAIQAGSLYNKATVSVVHCKCIAQCYSAMATIDFCNPNIDDVLAVIDDTIQGVYAVSVTRATKNMQFGAKKIVKDNYLAVAGDNVLSTGANFENVVLETVKTVIAQRECGIINMFYGQRVTQQLAEQVAETIEMTYCDVEVCLIPTQDTVYDLVVSFE